MAMVSNASMSVLVYLEQGLFRIELVKRVISSTYEIRQHNNLVIRLVRHIFIGPNNVEIARPTIQCLRKSTSLKRDSFWWCLYICFTSPKRDSFWWCLYICFTSPKRDSFWWCLYICFNVLRK